MPISLEAFNRMNYPESCVHSECRFDEAEGRLTVSISGQLDEWCSKVLTGGMLEVLEDGRGVLKTIVIDLGGLTYISSSGVGALCTMMLSSRDRGVALFLYRVDKRIKSVFTLLGLWEYFEELPDTGIKSGTGNPLK
jgi:anti-anti-sigma factor